MHLLGATNAKLRRLAHAVLRRKQSERRGTSKSSTPGTGAVPGPAHAAADLVTERVERRVSAHGIE